MVWKAINPLENYIPVPESGCWLWLGAWGRDGYGKAKMPDRTNKTASRLFFEAFNGEIPAGMFVCHKCDTPACCNPEHLFIGSNRDNIADRHKKGRNANGVRQGSAKLSDEVARSIFSDLRPSRAIAKEHGVDKEIVLRIRKRKLWHHATRDLP